MIVLVETLNPKTRLMTNDARLEERVFAFITTACRLNPGVDSRASNPKA